MDKVVPAHARTFFNIGPSNWITSPTTEGWTHREQQQPKAEHKDEEGRDNFQHTCRAIRSAYHSPSCLILPPSKTTSRAPVHSSCGHSACGPSPPLQVTSYIPHSGPPPCPFSPGAVDDKRSQWDIASDASSLPSHQHVSVGLQSPPLSEQSCYSRRLTEYSFDASGPGPPTQQHTPYTGLGVPSNQSPWLDPQPDSRVIQQQPLSPQPGPPTQPQDKLTSSLCTATTVLRSQTGCTLGQSSRATC